MPPILNNQWMSFYLLLFAYTGFYLFLYGFFPLKYHGGSEASWEDLPTDIEGVPLDGKNLYTTEKVRIVIMVVDALRHDFVSKDYMPYTQSLIDEGGACLYKAQAEPPTVTMPRVKAMTTGTVSNFIDCALNFGEFAITEDNFVHQAKLNNKLMTFYGDDTWIRLFPDTFNRSDGTISFYVSDYTEVDNNVTRHLPNELPKKAPDWDMMILHYLGLDHIGHLEGPSSPKVKPKMKEMDNIVKYIMDASKNWEEETVLILCGDHGMRDSGSHGGATYNEVTVPFLITQKKGCSNSFPIDVNQIDISNTVSYLLNIPFSKASTAKILPQVLAENKNGNLATEKALYTLFYNAKMNVEAFRKNFGDDVLKEKECYKLYLTAVKHHKDWILDRKLVSSAKIAAKYYMSSMDEMSNYLTKSAVEFDMFAIILAIFIMALTFITQMLLTVFTFHTKVNEPPVIKYRGKSNTLFKKIAFVLITSTISLSIFEMSCGVTQTNSALCNFNAISILTVSSICAIIISNIVFIRNIIKYIDIPYKLNPLNNVLLIGTFIQALTYGGSSFVEEEHQTWYFFWMTAMFFILVYTGRALLDYFEKKRECATEVQDKEELYLKMESAGKWLLPQWVGVMILHRFLRTLNQTGDKWAFLPDTGDWLNEDEHKVYLSVVTYFTLLCLTIICFMNISGESRYRAINYLLILTAISSIIFFRASSQTIHTFITESPLGEMSLVRIFWICIFAMIITDFMSSKNKVIKIINSNNKLLNCSYLHNEDNAYVIQNKLDYDFTSSSESVEVLEGHSRIFLNIVMLVLALYMRPHNIVLVPSMFITSKMINKILDFQFNNNENEMLLSKTLLHYWMGVVFYFYHGNSNSLSTIDLASGYIGLESYIPAIVGFQMGIHTYAGPLLAAFLLFTDCTITKQSWDKFCWQLKKCVAVLVTAKMYPLVIYTIIATAMRYHLFIWTVFSPKLLYDCTSTFFLVFAITFMMILKRLLLWKVKLFNRNVENNSIGNKTN